MRWDINRFGPCCALQGVLEPPMLNAGLARDLGIEWPVSVRIRADGVSE
jgi:hypothetical protein